VTINAIHCIGSMAHIGRSSGLPPVDQSIITVPNKIDCEQLGIGPFMERVFIFMIWLPMNPVMQRKPNEYSGLFFRCDIDIGFDHHTVLIIGVCEI
jgi:hypothetical protein